MPRIALIANPEAGSGGADSAAGWLRRLGATVTEFSLGRTDAAVASAPDRVAVAGGDGSLAGVAAAAGRAGIPMAVIPAGTANDFARRLGIPLELEAACRVAVRGTALRRLDLALMDGRPFLNVASLGLPPAAAERAGDLKGVLGPLAYVVGAVRAGLRADPVTCAVHCDGVRVFAGRAWQVTVASTGAFGAGSSVAADPADGRLDVVVIRAGSRLRLARHARGLRTGDLRGQPGVGQRRCRAATVEIPGRQPFNVDGELIEAGTSGFSLDPRGFTAVVG